MLERYIIYTHIDSEVTTVGQFLDQFGISIAKELTSLEFLTYEDDNGEKNIEKIKSFWTQEQFSIYEDKYNQALQNVDINYDNLPFNINTIVVLPSDKLFREIVAITGKNQFVQQQRFTAFFSDKYNEFVLDPKYRPLKKVESSKFEIDVSNIVQEITPIFSIWIWVRSLGKIFNISSFVTSLTTNITPTGGNFTLQLLPVQLEDIRVVNDYYFSDSFLSSLDVFGKLKEEIPYFYQLINTNDFVLIKFEQLELEEERLSDFEISKNRLPNQIYDMIGLVDSNSLRRTFESNDSVIIIEGRDLTKVLIEDQSYFFPLSFTQGDSNVFVSTKEEDRFIKRLFTTGKYELQTVYSYRGITRTVQFIINQLASLGIVPDDLFSSYGDRRTKVYRLDTDSEEAGFVEKEHNGIWQIIKLLVDKNVSDRRIADFSISQPDGSLINQFWKICQFPFVEFFTDTYGDLFYFMVRQPPFTGDAIKDMIRNSKIIDIEGEDVIEFEARFDEEDIYTWFEIKPQGSFIGQASYISLAWIPIIYLPEYANIWGSKRLSIVTNYIPYSGLTGSKQREDRDYFREAIVNDLKFLIDIYSYIPFTRKANLIINGDRRIKRGTFVRYKPTDEIYYVETVSNNCSISDTSVDRNTVLNLSRGMKEEYVMGKEVTVGSGVSTKSVKVSYFDIVNTEVVKETLITYLMQQNQQKVQEGIHIKSNVFVNSDVFDFFLQRKQFNK